MAEADRTGYGPGTYTHNEGVEAARDRVELGNAIDRDDAIDAGLAEAALRAELGLADFETGRRMLQTHLSGLPPERVRAIVAAAKLPTGVHPEHDPGVLMALAQEILGPLPTNPEAIDAELASSRKRMASKEWFTDDRAQLRYRMLLKVKGG